MAINYVKFQRGTRKAFQALLNASRIDDDTLYFIYPEDDSSVGELYLGTRLISGSGEGVITATKLSDLIDVNITGTIADSFLVQDTSGNWIQKTLKEVADLISGNLDIPDNIQTELENISNSITNIQNEFNTYQETTNTEISNIKNDISTIQGDITNLNTTIEETNSAVTNINNTVNNLIENTYTKDEVYNKEETDNAIASAVAGVDHLKREIFATLDEAEAQMQKYVLEGTADRYIYMVARANGLTGNYYDEYMAFEVADTLWALERVGDWDVDLSDYATKEDLESKVDKIDGHRLITPAEQEKLASLVIGDDGGVEISGKVNASNVQELYDVVKDIVTGTGQGTYDDKLQDKLAIEAGAEKNVIDSVSDEFVIDENRQLSIDHVNGIKIVGLAENETFSILQTEVENLGIRVTDVETKFDNYVLASEFEERVSALEDILTWKDMDEPILE